MAAVVIPLPTELTTPPVTKMYFGDLPSINMRLAAPHGRRPLSILSSGGGGVKRISPHFPNVWARTPAEATRLTAVHI